jgi:hypothetical protein
MMMKSETLKQTLPFLHLKAMAEILEEFSNNPIVARSG